MGWLSWLDPPSDFDHSPEKRSKSGKAQRYTVPGGNDLYLCSGCGMDLDLGGLGRCKCDPELGRKRKWYE